MLDFERRGCFLRYSIIISFESSKGTGTGETNGVLEQILNYSMVDVSNLFSNIFALRTKYNVRRIGMIDLKNYADL